MKLILSLFIGILTPIWGHTWLTEKSDRVYALKREFAETSTLCVLQKPAGDSVYTQADMRVIGEYENPEKGSCHITILDSAAILSNYGAGTLSIMPLDSDGIPKGNTIVVRYPARDISTCPMADRIRQTRPYIHSSWISPDGKSLVVVDLGSDKLYIHKISGGTVSLDYKEVILPEGSGPRHCAFSGKDILYVATELSDEVLVYKWPEMRLVQRNLTNREHPHGGAHVLLSSDGKFLYASSRLKNDGIAIFKVKSGGLLKQVGYTNTGAHPRHFAMSNDETKMMVACRDDNVVGIYKRDRKTGILKKLQEITAEKPVYVCEPDLD